MLVSWSCGDSNVEADTETPASSTDTAALGTTGPSSAETSSDSGLPLDSSGSSTASDSGSTGDPCEPVLVFSDDFDDLGPPFSREFPGLPEALFALDRFTQVQLEPQRSGNTIALDLEDGNDIQVDGETPTG